MATLDKYICELLYNHDCVIVPSLGGFLASNVQAKLNPAQHNILPPRRKIAFNIYLRQNDGLLANHLVEYEKVTYAEAISRIDQYVQDCFSALDKHRKVIVERVGTIYYDREKHLLFEPFRQTQFRKDAFGLSAIQFLPVQRDSSGTRIEQQRRELMKARPSVRSGRTFLNIKKSNYKILGLVAIAGTLLWFSFNLFLLKPQGGFLGSLNPFSLDSSPAEIITNPEVMGTSSEIVNLPLENETVFVASTEPVNTKAEISSEPKTQPAVNKEEPLLAMVETKKITPVKSISIDKPYHVVAGAFKISENAETYMKTLQSQGFKETHIIRKGNLNYVTYSSFGSRSEAITLLDSLRGMKAEGWIWNN